MKKRVVLKILLVCLCFILVGCEKNNSKNEDKQNEKMVVEYLEQFNLEKNDIIPKKATEIRLENNMIYFNPNGYDYSKWIDQVEESVKKISTDGQIMGDKNNGSLCSNSDGTGVWFTFAKIADECWFILLSK